MGIQKKAGTDLLHGIDEVSGMIAQSGSTAAAGELKTYKDEDGNYISLYLVDGHTEVEFEGLLEASAAEHELGDTFTAFGVSGRLTKWQIQWSNDDVAKVSGALRDFEGLDTSSGSGSNSGSNSGS